MNSSPAPVLEASVPLSPIRQLVDRLRAVPGVVVSARSDGWDAAVPLDAVDAVLAAAEGLAAVMPVDRFSVRLQPLGGQAVRVWAAPAPHQLAQVAAWALLDVDARMRSGALQEAGNVDADLPRVPVSQLLADRQPAQVMLELTDEMATISRARLLHAPFGAPIDVGPVAGVLGTLLQDAVGTVPRMLAGLEYLAYVAVALEHAHLVDIARVLAR